MLAPLLPLASLFVGEYAAYRDAFVLEDDPRPAISGSTFVDAGTLDAAAARLACRYGGSDRRALISMWSKFYFIRLLPPVIAANLLLRWHLPVALETLGVILDDEGLPTAFKLPHAGTLLPPSRLESQHRFDELLNLNLAPYISASCAYAQLSPRVLWANAGNCFEASLRVMERQPGIRTEELRDGDAFLGLPMCADGSRNPLFRPIRYRDVMREDGGMLRLRELKVCCIRYLLPRLTYCQACPIPRRCAERPGMT
jgi:ferric iron reductase protein FhuF